MHRMNIDMDAWYMQFIMLTGNECEHTGDLQCYYKGICLWATRRDIALCLSW